MRGRHSRVRRRDLICSAAALILMPVAAIAQARPSVIVVSRERLLREVKAARILGEAERKYTADLQAKIDQANETFSAEEAEISELRSTLSSGQLTERIADFDRRVRRWRRTAQERAGELQFRFQEERARIVAFLPAVLEQVRREAGADVIMNGDQLLASAPGIDATARAIQMFDTMAPPPVIPDINMDLPLITADEEPESPPEPSEQ